MITRPIFLSHFLALFSIINIGASEPLPIASEFWQSTSFRNAFTGSYGIDSRIEPLIGDKEKAVLEKVADFMKRGARTEAIAVLQNSSLLDSSAALSFNLGNLQFEAGENKEAIDAFERAIKLYPAFRDAHRNVAVVHVRSGAYDAAEKHLLRAAELGAQDGFTLGLLGYIHLQKGRTQAALQAYRLAQVTMPTEIQWRLGEAQCLLALDEIPQAAALFGELLEFAPDDSSIWMRQADAFLKLKRLTDAIANLELVRLMGDLDGDSLLLLGNLYLNEDLIGQGMNHYLAALEQEDKPEPGGILNALDYLIRRKLWKEAHTFAENLKEPLVEKFDVDQKGRLSRANAFIEYGAGDRAKGVELLKEHLRENPLDGDGLLALADHHRQKGNEVEAVMLWEQAILVEASAQEALLTLAEHLASKGLYLQAIEQLEKAQQIAFSDEIESYLGAIREVAGVSSPY